MIVLEGLSKAFGQVQAVDKLSFSVQAGEIFGLLGPNGAGKTTTIRMLGALIGPSAGDAWINGYRVGHQDQDIRRSVGILTEAPGLYDQLSAERNLEFYAQMYAVGDMDTQIERYLKMLGLWERRHEAVGTFSKGMRQKLAIARTLLHEPNVLFLDEPTSGLDPQAARMMRGFIADLKSDGRAIIMCTHNLDEADRLCDRIAVIKGSLLALDTPTALRRKLFGRTVVFHLSESDGRFAEVISRFEFVQSADMVDNKLVVGMDEPEQHNPELIRVLVEAGAEIQFVGELRQRLEDVYLQLVNQEN
ncbi:MAG: ABC transporter ATP-binding protein [Anaerolineales bacterium]|nr:ABC transporter ATP-binding protein [Chloroflexota bacterium]MBL6980845.1 ABC transporter ATP-binding protein [Anaerolineales bacterium]